MSIHDRGCTGRSGQSVYRVVTLRWLYTIQRRTQLLCSYLITCLITTIRNVHARHDARSARTPHIRYTVLLLYSRPLANGPHRTHALPLPDPAPPRPPSRPADRPETHLTRPPRVCGAASLCAVAPGQCKLGWCTCGTMCMMAPRCLRARLSLSRSLALSPSHAARRARAVVARWLAARTLPSARLLRPRHIQAHARAQAAAGGSSRSAAAPRRSETRARSALRPKGACGTPRASPRT